MKREEMKSVVKGIIIDVIKIERLVGASDADVDSASELIMKVFEKSLEESISEAAKMIPGLGKLLRGVRK